MAVRRDKNTGEPIEELTRKLDFGKQMRKIRGTEDKTDVRREEYRRTGGIDKADDIGRDSRRSEDAFSPFEAPTLKVGVEQEQKTDTDQTRVFQARNEKVEGTVRDSIADPIVGWLVVIAGPGKGKACSLGYGSNSLGPRG